MASSALTLLNLLLVSSSVTLGVAVTDNNELSLCKAVSEDGMSVTWGVPNGRCNKYCVPYAFEGGDQYNKRFKEAMTVSYSAAKGLCVCHAGSTSFFITPDNEEERSTCMKAESSDAEVDITNLQARCWSRYQKVKGTYTESITTKGGFKMKVPRFATPFSSKDFSISKCYDKCAEPKYCNSVELPKLPQIMDDDVKHLVAQGILQFNGGVSGGGKELMNEDIAEITDSLTDDDKDDILFKDMDKNKDNTLDVDEVSESFPYIPKDAIQDLIDQTDTDASGGITRNEFSAFLVLITGYTPITTTTTFSTNTATTSTTTEGSVQIPDEARQEERPVAPQSSTTTTLQKASPYQAIGQGITVDMPYETLDEATAQQVDNGDAEPARRPEELPVVAPQSPTNVEMASPYQAVGQGITVDMPYETLDEATAQQIDNGDADGWTTVK